MLDQYSRTASLLGQDYLDLLKDKTICVFGIGGVGGNVCDALARAGIKHFVLVDNDKVNITNINRQYVANLKTIGLDKVDVMEEHIKSIDENNEVIKYKMFYLPENSNQIDFSKFDYVVDAIDTVSAKLDIICKCKELNIPVISALGCGNKLDPTKLVVTDIYKTSNDPLAKVMRRELKKRNIKDLKVVYSTENAIKPQHKEEVNVPGSTPFVPPVAGIIIASEVIKDIIEG